MKLQNFHDLRQRNEIQDLGIEAIAADKELAANIQEILVWLKFLDPPADGKFGPVSSEALVEFQDVMNDKYKKKLSEERGFLGLMTAKALIETSPHEVLQPALDLTNNNLEARIINYMLKKHYRISTGHKKYNIVYIEGIEANGKINNDQANHFNDRRMVIEIPNKVPVLKGNWEATTEPGTAFTLKPMGRGALLGAARIAFGQYKAWKVGTHWGSGSDPHDALEQVGSITVHRDKNKDEIRRGDMLDTGLFEINQHWGFDHPRNDIGMASAGCLVGRTRAGHREFMALITQDKRYQLNKGYKFLTTIIPGDDLVKNFPG